MNAYSNRGQGVLLVLFALRELGGVCSKREVLAFIQNAGLYEITRHDLPPYPGQSLPRYQTLLAWARKDAMIKEWLVQTNERDAWQLSRVGIRVLDKTIKRYGSGEIDIRKCYLWTPKFKKQINPHYEPSPEDAIRPEEELIRLLEIL